MWINGRSQDMLSRLDNHRDRAYITTTIPHRSRTPTPQNHKYSTNSRIQHSLLPLIYMEHSPYCYYLTLNTSLYHSLTFLLMLNLVSNDTDETI